MNRIKDVVFERQYAQIFVNGKTGSRTVVLIDSIPFVKQWIPQHPKRNEEAILLCNMGRLDRMGTRSLAKIFSEYKTEFFPSLLKSDIPEEDKGRIRELLKKPWNPYVFRHTSLTEKCKSINEAALRQYAGWAGKSQMHLKYVHYYANEAANAVLKARGIIPDKQQGTSILSKPKECPNCSEPNDPLGKFCIKCKMVLQYGSYAEILEAEKKKDKEISELKERFADLEQNFRSFREWVSSRNREGTKKKIQELGQILEMLPDDYENDA